MLLVLAVLFQSVPFSDQIHAETKITQTIYEENNVKWILETTTDDENRMFLSLDTPQTLEELSFSSTFQRMLSTHQVTLKTDCFKDCNIKTLTLPANVTLADGCFNGSVIDCLICPSVTISSKAFQGNDGVSIRKLVFSGDNTTIPSQCFAYHSYLEEVQFTDSSQITVKACAFQDCKKLSRLSADPSVTALTLSFFSFENCTALQQVDLYGDCTLYPRTFGNCAALQDATFHGETTFYPFQQLVPPSTSMICLNMGGAFYQAFDKAYQSDPKQQVKKSITFQGPVNCITEPISETTTAAALTCNQSVIEQCDGLTDVTFEDTATLNSKNFISSCQSLQTIDFQKDATLGTGVFQQCENLDRISFQGSVDLWDAKSSPFTQCTANTISVSSKNKEDHCRLSFADTGTIGKVFLDSPDISGTIAETAQIQTLIFPEENHPIDSSDALKQLKDCQLLSHTIYGYDTSSAGTVRQWSNTQNQNGTFQNIISGLETRYKGTLIGDWFTPDDIKKDQLSVSAYYSYDPAQKRFSVSPDQNEKKGYHLCALPERMKAGTTVPYTVCYAGQTAKSTLSLIQKKVVDLSVTWDKAQISQLVKGQPVSAAAIVSKASLTYNNGEQKTLAPNTLTLRVIEKDNGLSTFVVTTKEAPSLSACYETALRDNHIVNLSAEYTAPGPYYVGDAIKKEDLQLHAVYYYDEDPTVPHTLSCSAISQDTLTHAGANVLTVSCGSLHCNLSIDAIAVKPIAITGTIDPAVTCYARTPSVDPKDITLTITYNNGTKHTTTADDPALSCKLKTLHVTDQTVTIAVVYHDLQSPAIHIPVVPKKISAMQFTTASTTLTAGAILDKRIITGITVHYNDGDCQTYHSTEIDYKNLSLRGPIIRAGQWNELTVTYMGFKTPIQFFGTEEPLSFIHASYLGDGYDRTKPLSVTDLRVDGIYKNGMVKSLSDAFQIQLLSETDKDGAIFAIRYDTYECRIKIPYLVSSNPDAKETQTPDTSPTVFVPSPSPVQVTAPEPTVLLTSSPQPTAQPQPVRLDNLSTSAPPQPTPTQVMHSTITLSDSSSGIVFCKKKYYPIHTSKPISFSIMTTNVTEVTYQLLPKGAKLSPKKWMPFTSSRLFVKKTKKPTILYLIFRDHTGSEHIIHTCGFYIDKKKPTCNISNKSVYPAGFKLKCKDNGKLQSCRLDGTAIPSTYTIRKKGAHTLKLTDRANNQKVIRFSIR